MTERRAWQRIALLTVPTVLLLGFASGWLSNSGYGNAWFDGLAKPGFMPPSWLFPVAWTILYILLGLALAMILAEPPSKRRKEALILFFAQMVLNYLWSPLFFAAHDIGLAKIVIFLMAGIAAAAAGQFYRLRPLAGLLMLPYLAWLIFAATLNSAIDSLNPGAGQSVLGL
ncbi:tryptophan-rich sensory protein [Sphingomonas piscis]|uniref:Tryptophan-rich sensory protein n=1 Tax=Sphingomonas piscis TaxID=2714943 RepID=A0A6G7YMD7_9SPHN|nr:TspO/MBR family protein [Sphingomonas piscis]QIK77901.1 tryptophan-rich sensory protein [Sphingomonas piscis]